MATTTASFICLCIGFNKTWMGNRHGIVSSFNLRYQSRQIYPCWRDTLIIAQKGGGTPLWHRQCSNTLRHRSRHLAYHNDSIRESNAAVTLKVKMNQKVKMGVLIMSARDWGNVHEKNWPIMNLHIAQAPNCGKSTLSQLESFCGQYHQVSKSAQSAIEKNLSAVWKRFQQPRIRNLQALIGTKT